MTLTAKLAKLLEIAGDGYKFIHIRLMLEDVEREIEKGNTQAIQFAKELDHVLRFCEAAAEKDL
jgi:hypothetical protein